jgi:ribonuclease BN (tRNA processing enzyme)
MECVRRRGAQSHGGDAQAYHSQLWVCIHSVLACRVFRLLIYSFFRYVVEEHEQPGKLRPALLKARGLRPGPAYRLLKQGEPVTLPNGDVILPSEVTGPPTRGRKAVILGDTADSSQLFDLGRNCDVLVHEATLSHDMVQRAVQRGHSTARMAGYTARRLNATLLALTHFSHRFREWSPHAPLAFGTTQHLALEAQVTFGRKAVVAATDFLRIPIARVPSEE